MMGAKLRLPVEEILPGDWTTMTGYRRVIDVTPVYATEGRGRSRREWLRAVLLERCTGDPDSIDPMLLTKDGEPMTYTVYRP